MKVDKISVSFDAALGGQVRHAAREAGGSLSSWLAGAAAMKLRAEALGAFLDEWEMEHGALTADELRRAAVELGLRSGGPAA